MKNAIGIDVGGTNIKGTLVSGTGNALKRFTMNTPVNHPNSTQDIKEVLYSLTHKLLQEGEVLGIGIGVAGIIDRGKGILLESPNIPSLNGFPIQETFEKKFSFPVVVENDANLYAYGVRWIGVGKEIDNFLVITLGTGIGGGIVYKGKLFEGPAEFGHLVIEPEGRVCSCGNVGCLEAYTSGWAIVNKAIDAMSHGEKTSLREYCRGNYYRITPEMIYKAALDGDTLARSIFRDMGRYMGMGIGSFINLFGPQAVIIGGGLAGAWDLFVEEMNREVSRRAIRSIAKDVKILRSTLGEDGGAVGAAGLIFERYG
ncbi:MAG TPA: ROK family protein, partial [Thermodesulfovibrionia bacterium]|nr:ROK family protein [Thermodesulfovibrionia bacterium]